MHTGNFGKVREAYAEARLAFPQEVIEYITQHVPLHTALVLDIGCGTGIATRQLQDRGVHVMGSDVDAGMIGEAEKTSPKISYIIAPAHQLPFQNNHFDAITAFSAFHWFRDKRSLSEIKRVLKGGSRFFVINKNDIGGFRKGYRQKLEELLGRVLPSKKDSYDPARILKDAGFDDIRTEIFHDEERFSPVRALRHIQSAAVWAEIPDWQTGEATELMQYYIGENLENGKAIRDLEVVVVSGLLQS